MSNTFAVSLTFLAYLGMMLWIGVWAYRRTNNLSDYILGGRQLGAWPSALSAGASDMSGWLLLGLPGAMYASGLGASWIAIGLLVGTYINWLVVAPRLRSYSQAANDSLTLPEYFSNRFEDTVAIRAIAAFFILLFFLFYTSSGLVAGGKLFETVFGLDYKIAVTIGTVAVVSYTLFGGYLAVSWTDLVQGLLMAAALIIVPITAFIVIGEGPVAILEAKNPNMLSMFTNPDGSTLGMIGIVSSLAWGLGYFGQPHILARFKGIKDRAEVKTARRIAVTWTFIGMAGALLVGAAGNGYFESGLADGETVFISLVQALFHPLVAGVLLAAILAAIMSTADSQLLVSSSALTEDFYKSIFNKDADPNSLMKIGRIAVVVIAVVAWFLALNPESSVLGLVSYAWAGFGAAFGPAVILSLYWPRMNRFGCLAGIVVGGLTVVIWKQLSGGIFDVYEIVPGFLLATLAITVVSVMSSVPSREMELKFQEVNG
ncbi:sodium/proline symporter PutP [Saccharospirillum salsuginis]|uniref:Sodium/proline symporter n=1 Tax=Saccharospirillum salsuginis TaxID=418750 RepID=A0A918KD43_9GAMM|nr:sodium/proline symporter PutP [Saccharospirillum salsuginis]GGX59358.1 sodium:proline symporter [Saccharospirillum salsuginis]